MRKSYITRVTAETDITLSLDIDGKGECNIATGIGFFDHMLTLFAGHGRFTLSVSCKGDTYVDGHHTVEDIGIALGAAFKEALGDKRGITRYADITLPMDEALILAAVDISGRSYLALDASIPAQMIGDFDSELVREFFLAFVQNAGITLHIKKLSGINSHHIAEGIFKAVARVLRAAAAIDPACADEIPSSKGVL